MGNIEIISGEELALIPKPASSSRWTKVEGEVNIDQFSVCSFRNQPCICYKDVPLWRTMLPIEEIDIFLAPPGDDNEPYVLICLDVFGDAYTYGCWRTLEQARAWLSVPKALY